MSEEVLMTSMYASMLQQYDNSLSKNGNQGILHCIFMYTRIFEQGFNSSLGNIVDIIW